MVGIILVAVPMGLVIISVVCCGSCLKSSCCKLSKPFDVLDWTSLCISKVPRGMS